MRIGTKKVLSGIVMALLVGAFSHTTARAAGFDDVQDPGKYYYAPVYWAVEQNITKGTSERTFSPDDQCTRGQIVSFLWREAGEPEPSGSANPFSDVKEGKYYYKAVLWAVENNITKGLTETTFGPDEVCSRAQVVSFLYRSAGSPAAETGTAFLDVPSSKYYAVPVAWAVNSGITKGVSATEFGPDKACTRGQVVAFLYRKTNPVPAPVPSPSKEAEPVAYNPPAVHSTYHASAYTHDSIDIYVSPYGNDANAGTQDAPLQTFEGARTAARNAAAGADHVVTVGFLDGEYYVNTSLNSMDSGSETVPIVYCAVNKGKVLFNGLDGYIINANDADHITFEGIHFTNGSRLVFAEYCDYMTFRQCEFTKSTEEYAVNLRYAHDNLVSECVFHDLLQGAVFTRNVIDYGNPQSFHNVIDNNLFYNWCTGEPKYGFSAVAVHNSVGARVSHNEFKDAKWSAIRYFGIENIIEYNLIENVKLGMNDFGLIYTERSVVDRGNIIRYNILSNGINTNYEYYGIYLDNGICGQEVYGNMFYNAGSVSVMVNGGRDNLIHDNISINTNGFENFTCYMASYKRDGGGFIDARNSINKVLSLSAAGQQYWQNKYPEIFSYNMNPDATGDPNCIANPAGNNFYNNYGIGTYSQVRLEENATSYVQLYNNTHYAMGQNPVFVSPTAGNYTIADSFADMKTGQIGRY